MGSHIADHCVERLLVEPTWLPMAKKIAMDRVNQITASPSHPLRARRNSGSPFAVVRGPSWLVRISRSQSFSAGSFRSCLSRARNQEQRLGAWQLWSPAKISAGNSREEGTGTWNVRQHYDAFHENWWAQQDSNLQPEGFKRASTALY